MGRHGPLRALEQGFSAGGQRGLPGRSKRGAVALRGAKGLSSPLCGEGAYLRFRSGLFYIVLCVSRPSPRLRDRLVQLCDLLGYLRRRLRHRLHPLRHRESARSSSS